MKKVAEFDWVYGRYNELVNGGYFMVYKPTFTFAPSRMANGKTKGSLIMKADKAWRTQKRPGFMEDSFAGRKDTHLIKVNNGSLLNIDFTHLYMVHKDNRRKFRS